MAGWTTVREREGNEEKCVMETEHSDDGGDDEDISEERGCRCAVGRSER